MTLDRAGWMKLAFGDEVRSVSHLRRGKRADVCAGTVDSTGGLRHFNTKVA